MMQSPLPPSPSTFSLPRKGVDIQKDGPQEGMGAISSPAKLNKALSGDTVRFSSSGDTKAEGAAKTEETTESQKESSFDVTDKLKSAAKEGFKSAIEPKFWLKQAGIAAAITLATCWLPGSQLVLIPAWLAMAGTLHVGGAAIRGFNNPGGVPKTNPENPTPTEKPKTTDRSFGDKLKGAAMGAWTQAKSDFFSRFKQNLIVSGAITLATCWLPGSQLLTIPAWFCMDAAISAFQGGLHGWYGTKPEDPNTTNQWHIWHGTGFKSVSADDEIFASPADEVQRESQSPAAEKFPEATRKQTKEPSEATGKAETE